MDAREIESLSMVSRGFQELRDVNPELAYNVILDILAGINECVPSLPFPDSGYLGGRLGQQRPTSTEGYSVPTLVRYFRYGR